MAPRKKRIATVLILSILALMIGAAAYFYLGGFFGGDGKEPTGTWSVEESFPGSPVSDFKISVRNLKKATHFELHIDDVQIGDRVALDGYVRSVPLIFTKPDLMEVWFFDNQDAAEPFIRARCQQSGALLFLKSNGAYDIAPDEGANKNGSTSPAVGDDASKPDPSRRDGKNTGGGLLDDLKQWWRKAIGMLPHSNPEKPTKEIVDKDGSKATPPVEDSGSGDNPESDLPDTDLPSVEPAGRWSVEEDTPPTSLFTVSVVNIVPEAYYELYSSEMIVGKRVPLDKSIRSISLVFSEPSLLKVNFYADGETTSILAQAECTEGGELIFIQ